MLPPPTRRPQNDFSHARVLQPRAPLGIKGFRYVDPAVKKRKLKTAQRMEHLGEHLLAELTRLSKSRNITHEDRQLLYHSVNRWKVLRGRLQRRLRPQTWIDLALDAVITRRDFLFIRSGNNRKAIHHMGLLIQKGGRTHSAIELLNASQQKRYFVVRDRIENEHQWLRHQQNLAEELFITFMEYHAIQRNAPLQDRSIRAIFAQLAPKLERLFQESPEKLV